ncbi:MAG: ATP-binding protein [Candidatus Bathyarchaeia archaeon]
MSNSSGKKSQPEKIDQNELFKQTLERIKRDKLQIAYDILESIDDYIMAFDRNWNITYSNKKNSSDLGYKTEELLGKNWWSTFPRFIGTDLERIYHEVMNKRQIKSFEWKTIYADTGWREFKVFPSADGISVYGVDVTERKKLQQKVEDYTKNLEKLVKERTEKVLEGEKSYRELYESFGEAFIATDWELNVIHWNKAAEKVTTVLAKEALGKKIYNVLPEMTAVNIDPFFEQLKNKKPARFMMNTVSRQSGRPAIFEVSTYPSTLGIIIIVEDKTVEEETKRLSAIGQTAGMVGHDIRNPLQSIVSSMFLIKTDLNALPESPEKSEALTELNSIQEQITYVDKIVSDLQDYARPLMPETAEVDLKLLITSSLSTLIIPDNIEVLTAFTENLPNLKTDPLMLKRILLNLATNAIQAMPEGGKLTINTSINKETEKIQIAVKDTGVGIPKAMQEKLFTPLVTTKPKGQGLGLAVVKRLIEALGGSLTFESQEGKGTTFTITLPKPNGKHSNGLTINKK